MIKHSHHRFLVIVVLAVLIVFATGAVHAATSDSPTNKDGAEATYEAQSGQAGSGLVTPDVYIATGANFPDALAAGAAGGAHASPILLVEKDTIPKSTADTLQALHPGLIFVIGGTAVISNKVENDLNAYAPAVVRIAGANRYETAAAVAQSLSTVHSTFAVYDTSSATTPIAAACTMYDDLMLGFSIPGPGTIIVEANANLGIHHASGKTATYSLYLGTSPTDCPTNGIGWGADRTYVYVNPEPSGPYFPWVQLKKIIHSDGPDYYKFYLNGTAQAAAGESAAFNWGYIEMTFIPDPGT